jgi:hypothetical protein
LTYAQRLVLRENNCGNQLDSEQITQVIDFIDYFYLLIISAIRQKPYKTAT